MNELALFAGAGIMKPHTGVSWIPNDAASARKNCRFRPSISAKEPSRITQLASCANAQWQKTGTSATRTRQTQRCVNGESRTPIRSGNTAPTTDRNTTGKNSSESTALNMHGLMSNYKSKTTPARAVSGNSNGVASRQLRMSITATTRKPFAEFSAIDATPFLAYAKTMTSCLLSWGGI